MQNDPSPDDAGYRPSAGLGEPDAHGQAALLLSESILHVLIEAKALSIEQAIDAVRTASEVKLELAEAIGESAERMRQSLSLLSGIKLSLKASAQASD